MLDNATKKVFISYSWRPEGHKAKVLNLTNALRRDRVDCWIDQGVFPQPAQGWSAWTQQQVQNADFVIIVCSPEYSEADKIEGDEELHEPDRPGKGVVWEARFIRKYLYESQGKNKKAIPIAFESGNRQHIPFGLNDYNFYELLDNVFDKDQSQSYEALLRHIYDKPYVQLDELGEAAPDLPPITPLPTAQTDPPVTKAPEHQLPPAPIPSPDISREPDTQTQAAPDSLPNQPLPPASPRISSPNSTGSLASTPDNHSSPANHQQLGITARLYGLIAGISVVLLAVAVGSIWAVRDLNNPTVQPAILPIAQMPRTLEQRISAGEKNLIPQEEIGNRNSAFEAEKQRAMQVIANQDYEQAVTALENAIQLYKNAPETLIYLNNARIGQKKAHTLAVTAPIGSSVDDALAVLRGVAQAQDEINQMGGINGVPLRIVIVNDDDNQEIATEIAATLSKSSEILGVIGHFSSSVTLATRAVYDAQQIPSISATSTSVNLSAKAAGNTAGYGFRVVPNDGIAARSLADYMTGTLNKQQVAIFYEQGDPYSESLKNEFTFSVVQSGGEVVGEFDINQAGFNAETSVEQAIDNQAQVLMVAPSSQSASLEQALQVIQANNRRLQLLGGDAIYTPRVLQEGGAQLSGMVVAVFWDIDAADQASDFPERSAALWGGAEVNWITAMAYDATQAFIGAIKLNPTDVTRAKIQETLSDDSFSIMGASGTVRFLSNGDRSGKAQLVEIQSAPGSRLEYDFVPIP